MNNIHVVLVAYVLDITDLVTALDSESVTFHLFLHSKIPAVVAVCERLARLPNVHYHGYGTNRGLSVSWNDGIIEAQQEGADAIIILNDDLEMSRTDLLILAQAAVDHREAGVIICQGYDVHWEEQRQLGFGAFAVNPIVLETVGFYDQDCNPYAFEDSDYSRRCSLCGITFHDAGLTGIRHLGSQAVKLVPELRAQNQITFPATKRYYAAKHGGVPGEEKFTSPWNDPSLSWVIEAEKRNNPYPSHKRTDLEDIVKL